MYKEFQNLNNYPKRKSIEDILSNEFIDSLPASNVLPDDLRYDLMLPLF